MRDDMNDNTKNIYRFYTEKKPVADIAGKKLCEELAVVFGLRGVKARIFIRYDIEGVSEEDMPDVVNTVISDPVTDVCYRECLPSLDNSRILCVEALPGQFDIRADSCEQCIQMLLGGVRPRVKTAVLYAFWGINDDSVYGKVRGYLINPVECRETDNKKPSSLRDKSRTQPEDIPVINGFTSMTDSDMDRFIDTYKPAMSRADIKEAMGYFAGERRDPTMTEFLLLDTYWSDHCRHTTFNTIIKIDDISDKRVRDAYEQFCRINEGKPVTLMNIATAGMRALRAEGRLPLLDESDENNACCVRVKVDTDTSKNEDWLLFFKNETHNHPTEIEPFGGAATCIGGAIRDPLSGRAFVYHAMRITGAGDPRKSFAETLPGKLPQRKLTTTAAAGFSSYGNQIGLATGFVREIYHEGYIAKRLETGAVIGAAKAAHVRREKPSPGDMVVLLGGRTGKDGIGGATGSSKKQDKNAVSENASEVQKGNAPEERKLQRLFRNPDVAALIKKCNDFGAGGAAVAIGELADGVEIDLSSFPVKYEGLNGSELAISESQERMAVVTEAAGADELIMLANEENIEATVVAVITDEPRLVMKWRGREIVNIKRSFLDTNGAKRYASVKVPHQSAPDNKGFKASDKARFEEALTAMLSDLNICSQKGLVDRFDSTIGAGSVLVPYGGKSGLGEAQVMAALFPARGALTASVMAYGYNPYITEADPFGGSVYAVVLSVAKLIAAGVELSSVHLSLQEYFPRISDEGSPTRWGMPFSAMLGAFCAQMGLGVAAIGGKDSMSGTFDKLDVPPTLISFAVGTIVAYNIVCGDFPAFGVSLDDKNEGAPRRVYLLRTPTDGDGLPDYGRLKALWDKYARLRSSGAVCAARVCEAGGVYGAVVKMSFGNMTGFAFKDDFNDDLFSHMWGSVVFETDHEINDADFTLVGYIMREPAITAGGERVTLDTLKVAYTEPLEEVFPTKTADTGTPPVIEGLTGASRKKSACVLRAAPLAVVPVFPGTNCEYDTIAAIERAGGKAQTINIRNLTPDMLKDSLARLEKALSSAQMLVLSGGFSGGDEPDGSGKFIVSLFRNPRLTEAVHSLLYDRDGLALGICNGFQALVKMGFLPEGRISRQDENSPTLTFNTIGRHQSLYVYTRIASMLSPWLLKCDMNDVYSVPVSHGEGRFIAEAKTLDVLREGNQIAFQYTDENGIPSMRSEYNPNGSVWAIEGITSPCGRVLGKMGHTERADIGGRLARNIDANKYMPLFEGGVGYFK